MKNKRVFYLMSIIIMFIMIICLATNVTNATEEVAFDPNSNSSDYPTTYYYYTQIERWTPYNDLVYTVPDYDISYLARTVYLAESGSLDTPIYTILDEYSGSGGGTYTLDENNIGNNISESYNGSTLYLVEKYEVVPSQFDYSSLTVGVTQEFDFPAPGTLSLNISGTSQMANSVKTTAMADYSVPSYSSRKLKVDSQFQSSAADEPLRDVYIYPYLELQDTSTSTAYKSSEISLGTVRLPVFYVKIDLTATGTGMPAGYFNIQESLGNEKMEVVESTYGSAVGYVGKVQNDEYSYFSFANFTSSSSFNISYGSADGERVDSSDYSFYATESNGAVTYSNLGDNVWMMQVKHQFNSDVSISNGIFYNVLPFVIIAIVAVLGIAILKKNSIK